MKTVNIGLIGIGTIGKGVVEAIVSNGGIIAERSGVSLVLKGICDKDKKALDSIDDKVCHFKTGKAEDLIERDDIDVIIELIGGVNPAKDIILSAIKNKKHVVTANKALLSSCWKEIFDAASANGVYVNFEASVGGAIPIIRVLRESFVANKIGTVYGILNGTTNFMLTKMAEEGCSFKQALAIAQEKGIAEKNPELDVSGKDSAHKLVILSRLAFGKIISPEDIYTEGIYNISPLDISCAAKWGYSVKLLAIAKNAPGGLQLRVHPTLIPSSHLLASVRGEDNAIFIKGDLIGDSLLYGKGAGAHPTASSVVGDVVDIARHIAFYKKENPAPYDASYDKGKKGISSIEELAISYYLRFSVIDKPGVLAGIASVLSDNKISIASVSQEERKEGQTVPVIILTHKAEEGNMRRSIAKIDSLGYVKAKTVVIRREE